MGGCCTTGPNRVSWENVTEHPHDSRFHNTEWIPKTVKKKCRFALPVATFDARLEDDDRECLFTGATLLGSGQIFLADFNNKKLKLYDSMFRFISSSQMPVSPLELCVIGTLPFAYVTFPSSCKIRKIEITKKDMRRVDTFETEGRCTGISSNQYGGLAVAVNPTGNQWYIQLMNSKGEKQLKVHGEQLFLNPEHIAITRDLNLVVSDRGNNTVYHITPKGYVIFAYKDIRGPLGVMVDNQGYIYVAGPEKVHQMNERGERIQSLLSKVELGFSPMCFAYWQHYERTIVAGRSNKVNVYYLRDPE